MEKESHVSILGLKCEYCGGSEFILDRDRGELVCVSCGHVALSQNIEEGPEWRSFEGEEKSRERVGLPPSLLMQDKGLSTVIGSEDEDSTGRRIGGEAKRDLNRLRKWQQRISIYSSIERNLSHALNELNKVGERLDIPRDVLERASYIYRLSLEKDLVRGRAINSIVAASLYAALRYYNIPRTLKELAKIVEVDKKELARCYRMLVKELKLKMPVVDPIKYVRKIAARGRLSKRVALEAEKIIRVAQNRRITAGKDPIGLAAAAVYYACVLLEVKKTQRDIAIAADITEVTVRNRYKSLSEQIKLERPITIAELRRS
ncbi:MAG: transcription initiation factor IIB [Nitrososphaeria archaeon]|nr:transcription initiation factor IIB [Nitrososphaeria archaeon]NIQ32284.1 transcription initiation factor IIB [Nitrososphaeria archaeon]